MLTVTVGGRVRVGEGVADGEDGADGADGAAIVGVPGVVAVAAGGDGVVPADAVASGRSWPVHPAKSAASAATQLTARTT